MGAAQGARKEGARIEHLHLSRDSGGSYHGNFRAPRRCRPSVTLTHEDTTALLAIEVGIGEGGAECFVQTIRRLGPTELAENVDAGTPVAFRVRQVPLGRVIISVTWGDPK
jgi:hypothetical protein